MDIENSNNSRGSMSEQSFLRERLVKDLLYFTRFFYKARTGNDFKIINPVGREARQKTICRALTSTVRGDSRHLIINVQPGSGKSELLIHYVCWCMAQYPDSKFIYLAHTKSLAETHTYTIKQIMSLPIYRELFGVSIKSDSKAKGYFKTMSNGAVMAFGSAGAITGQDAGLPHLPRFSGALIYDDAHKPDEVHSDILRGKVIRNYQETARPRLRGSNVPIIYIGQRLHEDDISNYFLSGKEGHRWDKIILKTIDDAGNNLCPDIISKEELILLQNNSPYSFSSQYQQSPVPSGNALYREDDFKIMSALPDIHATFITADTAETAQEYNDATVFSFWGVYRIKSDLYETELLGLHWIDCVEIRVEPKDLESEFLAFFASCMRFHVKPAFAAIEKKSTGTTLVSVLKNIQGLRVMPIERNRASGSKADRFIQAQSYISQKLVSLDEEAKHRKMVIDHMIKITANDTHRHDDIADTCVDAIKLALVDKLVLGDNNKEIERRQVSSALSQQFQRRNRILNERKRF